MSSTYGLRKHLATLASAEKPEAIAEREISFMASRRALVDCRAAYPTLTADNFEAADNYRKERTAF